MASEPVVPIELGLNRSTECEYGIGTGIEIAGEVSIDEFFETVSANTYREKTVG